MRQTKRLYDYRDHLLNLYLHWLGEPERYASAMIEVLDKIVTSILQHHPQGDMNAEDIEDLRQDLRLFGYSRLYKISNPTNKRIFNYLRVSMTYKLFDYAADRKKRQHLIILSEPFEEGFTPVFNFGDPLLDVVATKLSEGYSKKEVQSQLNLTTCVMKKAVDKLREVYTND